MSLYKDIKARLHRSKHGWAPRDTWNFEGYLSKVIVEGITFMEKEEYNHLEPEVTRAIIDGFRAYLEMEYEFDQRTENVEKFRYGMEVFADNFTRLWT